MIEPFQPPPYPYDRLSEVVAIAGRHAGGAIDLSVGTPCDPPPDLVLAAMASPGGAAGTAAGLAFKLTEHVRPAMTLIAEQSVRSAITLMQKARQTLAVVVDRQGRAIGLVTMKDLVEELVGDLENW